MRDVGPGQSALFQGDEWHDLRAITGHALWFHALARLGKDIENRKVRLPAPLVGRPICIHAGKTYDDERKSAEVGIRRILGFDVAPADVASGAIIAVAIFASTVTSSPSPWFFGPFGWPVAQMVPIEPIAFSGLQGFWRVPDSVKATVRDRYRETIRRSVP